MIYIVGGNVLFAYDSDTGLTFKFGENGWDISDVDYNALIIEENTKTITEEEALKRTNGKTPNKILEDFMSMSSNR